MRGRVGGHGAGEEGTAGEAPRDRGESERCVGSAHWGRREEQAETLWRVAAPVGGERPHRVRRERNRTEGPICKGHSREREAVV
ncbi:hypothetical protein NDU88_005710 [Pleurodeles waltl]|uniref:Uncharacterized protein n=1 Tax=Pleurodeles waltl TaxID=8319 RepID=A0AAV7QGR5_PLEWA|nr:hypothetical protein NDU88_005710 [Pleurodeles waltl]